MPYDSHRRHVLIDYFHLSLEQITVGTTLTTLQASSSRFATALERELTRKSEEDETRAIHKRGYGDKVTAHVTYDLVVPADAPWPEDSARIDNDGILLTLVNGSNGYKLVTGERMKLYEFFKERRADATLSEELNKSSFPVFVQSQHLQ